MAPPSRSTTGAAAAAGTVALNILCVLQPTPARSAWGWYAQPLLTNAGFTCAKGTGLGCGTAPRAKVSLNCTVVPNWGMKCDQTEVQMMCVNTFAPGVVFSPDSVFGPSGCGNLLGLAQLKWAPTISCGWAAWGLAQQNASEGHNISLHGALVEDEAHGTVHFMQEKAEAKGEL